MITENEAKRRWAQEISEPLRRYSDSCAKARAVYGPEISERLAWLDDILAPVPGQFAEYNDARNKALLIFDQETSGARFRWRQHLATLRK
jgi:hypothetical protein